jgi:transcriptional regulator with XRE-family HTH domain
MARPPKRLNPSASQAARLGAAVRQRREELGIIQEALAEMILFSRTHLAQVELGRASASEEFVRRCDDALNADGRLLAIYQEVVIERAQQRQRRTRDRRSNNVLRSRRGLRLVPSQDRTADQASNITIEPETSTESVLDRHRGCELLRWHATYHHHATADPRDWSVRNCPGGFRGSRRPRAVLAWARTGPSLSIRLPDR